MPACKNAAVSLEKGIIMYPIRFLQMYMLFAYFNINSFEVDLMKMGIFRTVLFISIALSIFSNLIDLLKKYPLSAKIKSANIRNAFSKSIGVQGTSSCPSALRRSTVS